MMKFLLRIVKRCVFRESISQIFEKKYAIMTDYFCGYLYTWWAHICMSGETSNQVICGNYIYLQWWSNNLIMYLTWYFAEFIQNWCYSYFKSIFYAKSDIEKKKLIPITRLFSDYVSSVRMNIMNNLPNNSFWNWTGFQ